MIVLQLATTGDIPIQCQSAMHTVEQWATRRGHTYRLIRYDVPDGWDVRAYSNQIRAEWAATHAPLLYVDWDVILNPDFEVAVADVRWHDHANPDAVFFVPEDDDNWWLRVATELLAYNESVPTAGKEPGRLWKLLRAKLTDTDYFFSGGYNHFLYSKETR